MFSKLVLPNYTPTSNGTNSGCFTQLSTFDIGLYDFGRMKCFLIGFKYAFFQLVMKQNIFSYGLSSSEVLIHIVCLYFSLVFFFLFVCRRSLYILDVNFLGYMGSNIFSHSVFHCLHDIWW